MLVILKLKLFSCGLVGVGVVVVFVVGEVGGVVGLWL